MAAMALVTSGAPELLGLIGGGRAGAKEVGGAVGGVKRKTI